MKHAGAEALERLSPLLAKLRARTALREKRPGVFYLGSRAFLHFHEDSGGLFADVLLADDFVRLPATSRSQRASLLKRIEEHLSTVRTTRRERV